MSVLKGRLGKFLVEYIQENSSILFLLFIIFVIGVSAGAFTVSTLNSAQKGELYAYINGLLQSKNTNITQGELFSLIFLNYTKLVLTLWFLGVTIVGIPLIAGLVGFKGFTIGFTVGFMLDVFTDLRGVLIIVSSILPQSLIILPCIIVLCVSGIRLSLFLLNGGNNKRPKGNEIRIRFIAHTVLAIFVLLITCIGALLESFVLPLFLNIIFYQFYSIMYYTIKFV